MAGHAADALGAEGIGSSGRLFDVVERSKVEAAAPSPGMKAAVSAGACATRWRSNSII
jgi:hypothetical protein